MKAFINAWIQRSRDDSFSQLYISIDIDIDMDITLWQKPLFTSGKWRKVKYECSKPIWTIKKKKKSWKTGQNLHYTSQYFQPRLTGKVVKLSGLLAFQFEVFFFPIDSIPYMSQPSLCGKSYSMLLIMVNIYWAVIMCLT